MSRYAPVVGPQSVEPDSASASVTSCSLMIRAASRASFSLANWALRRRVYAVRAVEKRCQSSSSVARSSRGSAFHWSSSARNRLTPPRQSLPAASRSASSTNCSLAARVSSCWRERSARRAARWAAITGSRLSSRATRPSRSPTAFAPATAARTVRTEVIASSGESAPAVIRVCSRLTSSSRAANRRVKKAMASSLGTSGTWPTLRSPSAVRT